MNNRNQTLDVLRGVLSWVVVCVHVGWFADYTHTLTGQLGQYAVDGFIVLSGFVITKLIVTKRESYPEFIFRRFMRLFPAYVTCILFALLVRHFAHGLVASELQREINEDSHFWWHLGLHLTMLHGLAPAIWLPQGEFALLVPGWSISLEFQLYLLAPLLVWWLARTGGKGLLMVLIPSLLLIFPPIASRLGLMGSIWSTTGAFLPQHYVYFVLGAMIYIYAGGGPVRSSAYRYWPFVVRLGEISYSTYLVHFPVLNIVACFVPVHWPIIARGVMLFGIGAPITLGLSLLLYRYVELTGIALGKHLSTRPVPLMGPARLDEIATYRPTAF